MDKVKELTTMCETLFKEIADMNKKIENANGKMSAGDLEAIQKLMHSVKSAKTSLAMIEAEEGSSNDDGTKYNSNRGRRMSYGMPYYGYMPSYGYRTERGYSRHGDFVDDLQEVMMDAPNDNVRREIQKLIDKVSMM